MKSARPLLMALCVGLILVGLSRNISIARPDRPKGTWDAIPSLKERDDLNLVVVLVDTLRANRMSAYGYERPTSPILEAMAESGIRFENTLAQSTWTKTSVASMLTATYPAKNRITRFNHVIPPGATLPSEVLKRAGFKTVGVWRNGWVDPKFGFQQGFDVYLKPAAKRSDFVANPSTEKLGGTDQQIVEAAAQFLRSAGDQRFFLYLHMMDVHQYVYDDAVSFGTEWADIYDQSIHWVDANIGTLIAALQKQGLMKKTVLAVVSDHGEAFHEHGLEGHARNLHIETTHVPFFILLPFRLEEPIVVKTPVENVDVFPTLLDLMGLPGMPEADGHSLVPLIEAAAQGAEPSAPEAGDEESVRFAELDLNWGRPSMDPKAAVLVERGPYRLHQAAGGTPLLFDSEKDFGEQHDVAADHPEVVAELQERARAYFEVEEPSWGGPGWVQIDELDAKQLRALGYAFDPHAPPEQRVLE